MSKEPWLFNGAKFRLHSFSFASLKCPSFSLVSPDHQVLSLDCVENRDTEFVQHAAQNRNMSINETETKDGVYELTEPILTLKLGLTCYKDYLGTNWSCQAEELRQRGEVEFSDPLVLLSQPLGVGAVLCTDDGQVVLIKRSQKVAEAGGLLDIPGGHPEPKVE